MRVLLLTWCLFVAFEASAGGDIGVTPPDDRPFEIRYQDVKSVYDGDTFTLYCPECEKGKIRVRLLGVDTPEIRGQCAAEKRLAIEARDFLEKMLRNARKTLVIPNENRNYDRYGRLLAAIEIDNQNVSELLIKNHLGRSYQGGKRQSWCNQQTKGK